MAAEYDPTLFDRGKQHPCNLYKGEDRVVWAEGYAKAYRVGATGPPQKDASPYLPGTKEDDLWHLGYHEAWREIRNDSGDVGDGVVTRQLVPRRD